MENDSPKFSVVVPVYGCPDALEELCSRLDATFSKMGKSYEIILVNDCCPKNSWEKIAELGRKDSRIIGLNLSRNFGQHRAITAGLDHVRGKWIVVMDCDLQDRPEEIERLYAKALEGHQIVLGRRQVRQDSFLKKLGSQAFYKLLSYLTETHQDPAIANFGVYHRQVIDAVQSMRESLRYFPVMVRWVGFQPAEVNIEHSSREHGATSYTFSKLFNLAIDVILAFSDKPLRLTVQIGFAISAASIFYTIYLLISALGGSFTVVGWSSLIISMWFLSGLMISIMGMLGIYVGRVFDQVKERPLYIVKERTTDLPI